ncbi:lipoprotein [Mycoplasma mycoides]|uniref:lipoprotein n=1 Tax=Mycoplasma mycoides TaxID=2102 RepID=UPI00223F6C71|nr:lipoprotein [Mycoplasma mycoides]QVK06083.1 lipoprotein [Mycoplasma mycoides subsp. capri]
MKKLLAILGTIAISSTGASLVIACDNSAKKENKSSVDKSGSKLDKPTKSGSSETSNQGSNEGSNKEKENSNPSKPSKPASGTASLTSAWSSIFMDSITGEDIQDHSAEEKEKADKANNKEFVEVLDEVNKLSAAFEKELKVLAEKVKEAKEQADKLAKQKEEKDKANNKEFVEVLDEVNKLSAAFEKELKVLAEKVKEAKEQADKLAKQKEEKDKANNKEFVEVLDEVNKLSAAFEKELKVLAEKVKEAKEKSEIDDKIDKEELEDLVKFVENDIVKIISDIAPDTTEQQNDWAKEKEKLVKLIGDINKEVETLTSSGKGKESVIHNVEGNLSNYKETIKNLKNSKDFWKFEMWTYWLEDILENLKK